MAIDTIGTKSSAATTGRGLSEVIEKIDFGAWTITCLLYTSPSPRDRG